MNKEQIKQQIQILQGRIFMINDKEKIAEMEAEIEELKALLKEEEPKEEDLAMTVEDLEIELPNEPYKRPMPTYEEALKDKKVDMKTLATMTLISKFEDSKRKGKKEDEGYYETPHNYLYHNKIIENMELLEQLSNCKADTIKRNVRKLCKLNNNIVVKVTTEEGKIIYQIYYADCDGKQYITVEEPILKVLTKVTNSNVIKVYLFIRALCENEYRKNGNKEKLIDRNYISQHTSIHIDTVSCITDALADLDLITKHRVVDRDDYGHIKEHIYYGIISYEEYREIKKAKKEARTTYTDRYHGKKK